MKGYFKMLERTNVKTGKREIRIFTIDKNQDKIVWKLEETISTSVRSVTFLHVINKYLLLGYRLIKTE